MLSSDLAWYDDVRVLVARPFEFFPSRDQSTEERLNSIVRLLLYTSVALFAYRRRAGYLALGVAAVAVVSLAYRRTNGPGKVTRPVAMGGIPVKNVQRAHPACVASTPDNPYANFLPTDHPLRPPACKYDDQRDMIERNATRGLVRDAYDVYDTDHVGLRHFTTPVTRGLPDTVAFADFCYGNSLLKPSCKQQPRMCTGFRP